MQVVKTEAFRKSIIILFLNKIDIFAEKIQKVDLSKTFPVRSVIFVDIRLALFTPARRIRAAATQRRRPSSSAIISQITCLLSSAKHFRHTLLVPSVRLAWPFRIRLLMPCQTRTKFERCSSPSGPLLLTER